MNSFKIRISFALLVAILVAVLPLGEALAQETEAATRQFAAAVGIQNLKQYDLAIEEWETFLKKFPKDPRVDKAQHYLGRVPCRTSSTRRRFPRLTSSSRNIRSLS